MDDLSQVRFEVSAGVATLTLNRPERLNAFTPTMARELVTCLDAADADDRVRVVVITGEGRAFCAGSDIDESRSTTPRRLGRIDGVPRDIGGVVSLRIAALGKIVISAINGAAVGVGASITLPADIRVAASSAKFGFVFARRGLVPEGASSWFLPRVVGISQAVEWVATGRVFDAQEALAGRLVSRVVPDEDLASLAADMASEIVANTSAVSVGLSRQLLWSMLSASSPWEAHRQDSRLISVLRPAPDAQEGMDAFLEKRPAQFPGSYTEQRHLLPTWPPHPHDLEEEG